MLGKLENEEKEKMKTDRILTVVMHSRNNATLFENFHAKIEYIYLLVWLVHIGYVAVIIPSQTERGFPQWILVRFQPLLPCGIGCQNEMKSHTTEIH